MSLLRAPYRWRPETAWDNLTHMWWALTHGIGNLIRWAPVIWHDVDWDQDPLIEILRYKLGRMATRLAGRPAEAKQCRICAELCRRLHEDEYFENAKRSEITRGRYGKHAEVVAVQDRRYLGLIIGKYLGHWWD